MPWPPPGNLLLGSYGIAPLFSSIGAELFQGRRFGAIFGGLSVCSGLGAGAGPWLTGALYDIHGNYDIAFLVALLAALVSMASIWMAGPGRVRMVGGRAARRAAMTAVTPGAVVPSKARRVEQVRAAAAGVPDVEVLGDPDDRLPHVVTFSVLLADGEALVDELARRGLAVASGSACTSSALRPSHVLAAMGVLTHGNVRIVLPLASVSPGRADDVGRLCAELGDAVTAVRRRMGTEGL